MRQLANFVLGVFIIGAVAAIALASPTGAPAALNSKPSLLSEGELHELGLRLEPIPESAKAAHINIAEAVQTAGRHLARTDAPAEIVRAMVPPDEASEPRSSYVIIYTGGRLIPGGPEGKLHAPRVSGVVIDDQTGEFLTGFYYGSD